MTTLLIAADQAANTPMTAPQAAVDIAGIVAGCVIAVAFFYFLFRD